jgi:hypothetical protein
MELIVILIVLIILLAVLLIVIVCKHSKYGKSIIVENVIVNEKNYDQSAKTLAVVLHGFSKDGQSLNDVSIVMKDYYSEGGINFIQPDLPLNILSIASTAEIIFELIESISKEWEKKKSSNEPYQRIVFVGHSFGALLVRKLFVVANGEYSDVPFERTLSNLLINLIDKSDKNSEKLVPPQPWVNKVERIVLLAGINRGWSVSHHMSIPRAITFQIGIALGYIIEAVSGKLPTIFTIRRGGSFIIQLRLQWLEMQKQRIKAQLEMPITVQLLGTIDDLVAPDDNIDLITGNKFIYIEVPESGHKTIIEMIHSDTTVKANNRKDKFKLALKVTVDTAPDQSLFRSDLRRDNNVTDVVFVIHGIRDLGYWTQRIARRTQALANSLNVNRKIKTETSTYGYFPMLSFLIPGARQQKVEWFMDRYTESKARYPNAKFHYLGHSHGTYLLAKALKEYASVKFDNVVFAGSVVKKDYEWDKFIPKRIKNVQNFVASEDWVVAIFPNAFQKLNWQDLGSAGYDGFNLTKNIKSLYQPKQFVSGGHSAALNEQMWDTLAAFILSGEVREPKPSLMVSEHSDSIKFISKYSPVVFLLILILFILVIPYFLFTMQMCDWKKTLVLVAYFFSIWMIVTRV